jgi:hypothetical protein
MKLAHSATSRARGNNSQRRPGFGRARCPGTPEWCIAATTCRVSGVQPAPNGSVLFLCRDGLIVGNPRAARSAGRCYASAAVRSRVLLGPVAARAPEGRHRDVTSGRFPTAA